MKWLCESCNLRIETPETIKVAPLCPVCKKTAFRIEEVSISDLEVGNDFLDIKDKNEQYPSKRKLRQHIKTGVKRGKDDRLVHIRRVINADTDQYKEKVIDMETGEVIRDCNELLSEHRGRGSERKK